VNLSGLRTRLDHLAGRVPQPLPEAGTTTEAVDLALAAGLVLVNLERWAAQRPGFEPMTEPTVWHQPDAADVHMAQNCRQLAPFLGEAHLVHAPGVVEARLGALYAMYETSGEHDEGVDAALADVRDQLPALEATGANAPEWCAKFLTEIARNPAVQATEQ
jgi:hypothetical protein